MDTKQASNKKAPGATNARGKVGAGDGQPQEKYTPDPQSPPFNPIAAGSALNTLLDAMPAELRPEIKNAFTDLYRKYLSGGTEPELIDQAAQVYAAQAKTLRDAMTPRKRQGDVIAGLLAERSLTIPFGPPGGHKTNLVMDWAMAVASNGRTMPSLPNHGDDRGRTVRHGAVLWVDVDSGEDVLAERLAAFKRGHNAADDAPFYWLTFPTPPLMASKGMPALTAYAKSIGAVMVVFDNLLRMAGVKDENSSEMDAAMLNLRKFAEDTGAAVVVIHHQRKPSNGGKADNSRAGASLRGHSSIEAAIDTALLIEREEDTDNVMVRCTKARRRPVASFGAQFTFESGDDSNLHSARFYQVEMLTPAQKKQDELKATILGLLAGEELNTRALYDASPGGKQATGAAVAALVGEKKIKSRRDGQSIVYFLV